MVKEKLLQMEKTGKYAFHGSPEANIEILEPRQGTHIPDMSKPTEMVDDGKPAISATPYVELAIFRAVINGVNAPFDHNSGFDVNEGVASFSVSSEKVLEAVEGKKGYVYVFNKNEFEPYSRDGEIKEGLMEWRSYSTVKPIEIIEVTSDDLPTRQRINITG
jgi:hypothetical protein